MNLYALLVFAVTGWLVAYQQFRRANNRKVLAAAADHAERKLAKVQHDLDTEEACSVRLRREASEEKKLRAEAERELAKQAKLATERFDLLEGVIEEKQIVWRLYRDSTRQAGVAQNWLLREYNTALQALNLYRAKAGQDEIRAPAQLSALIAEFAAVAAAILDAPPAASATVAEKAP